MTFAAELAEVLGLGSVVLVFAVVAVGLFANGFGGGRGIGLRNESDLEEASASGESQFELDFEEE